MASGRGLAPWWVALLLAAAATVGAMAAPASPGGNRTGLALLPTHWHALGETPAKDEHDAFEAAREAGEAAAEATKKGLEGDLKQTAAEKKTPTAEAPQQPASSGNLTSGDKLWTAKTVAMVAASKNHRKHKGPMHSELALLSHKFGQLKANEKRKQQEVLVAAGNKVEAEHKLLAAKHEAKKAEEMMEEKMRALKLVVHQKQEAVIAAEHHTADTEHKLKVAHQEQDKAQKRVDLAMDVVKHAEVEVDNERSSAKAEGDDPIEAEKKEREHKAHEKELVDHARHSHFQKAIVKWKENRARRAKLQGKDDAEVEPLSQNETEPAQLKVEDSNAADYKKFEDAFNAALDHHGDIAGLGKPDTSFESALDRATNLADKKKTSPQSKGPIQDTAFEKALHAQMQTMQSNKEPTAEEHADDKKKGAAESVTDIISGIN